MRIAFPSNDKINLFERTGRAEAFLILDVGQARIEEVDYRKNTHSHHTHSPQHDETQVHSHDDLVATLSDCAFVIVNKIGKHLMSDLTNAGIVVVTSEEKNIRNAIAEFNTGRHIGEGE